MIIVLKSKPLFYYISIKINTMIIMIVIIIVIIVIIIIIIIIIVDRSITQHELKEIRSRTHSTLSNLTSV